MYRVATLHIVRSVCETQARTSRRPIIPILLAIVSIGRRIVSTNQNHGLRSVLMAPIVSASTAAVRAHITAVSRIGIEHMHSQ